jgi:hypothetical protein
MNGFIYLCLWEEGLFGSGLVVHLGQLGDHRCVEIRCNDPRNVVSLLENIEGRALDCHRTCNGDFKSNLT